ncbi:M15 family metallopeptidase [Methylopila henanensis]|uniref:M15 family metallopeptidase n=1 Tax=Methylopila henanensis TaxID=873516 RepID=A0ABW4K6H3_9HYPH
MATTAELRRLWADYECKPEKMEVVRFGPDSIRVAPPTGEAWQALAAVLKRHGYLIREDDTDSYNCRAIKDGSGRSLHAFGIALDVNWRTNPYRDHAGKRAVRYSSKATQSERAEDVRLGSADTDMTAAMIDDVNAITTTAGKRVFEWGGSWSSLKDAMHFQIALSPDDLAAGINPASVAGDAEPDDDETDDLTGLVEAEPEAPGVVGAPRGDLYRVIARSGLNLRGGPATTFEILKNLPLGTEVFVAGRQGDWAKIDLQGDGLVDGFAASGFLTPAASAPPAAQPLLATPVVPSGAGDITGRITPDHVRKMFPPSVAGAIAANLGFVLSGLRARGVADRPMVLMALATIRAETEGFVPIPEGRSRFNTASVPFDKYDPGTGPGRRLGNTRAGDGARFKGRGYVQLTGRDNYGRIGEQLGVSLLSDPDRACEPELAGLILAQFLRNQQQAIRTALARNDLKLARKLVNGGSHGFERFKDAYVKGLAALPA